MRVRQFVVAARDLDSVVDDFRAVLGIEIGFIDPGVKEFGLRNAVMPVGHTFLEVVSPIDPKASAARYLARGGDGGYMLVVQCDNLDRDRKRLETLGVRTVWKLDLRNVRGTHLHPKDTGGTLLLSTRRYPRIPGIGPARSGTNMYAARWSARLQPRNSSQTIPAAWRDAGPKFSGDQRARFQPSASRSRSMRARSVSSGERWWRASLGLRRGGRRSSGAPGSGA